MTGVLELPVARLATTLAPLRGPRTDPASALAPLPLRVAATGDGTYEVLDGFKRLAAWTGAGDTHVPVVVEDAPGVVGKARLLEANAPRRTLSPMDEARVVRALADNDQLTPVQIAKLLGHKAGLSAFSSQELEALRAFHTRHDRVQEKLLRAAVADAESLTIPHVLFRLQSLLSPGET